MLQEREYKLLELIGEGSYGKVYKALHLGTGLVVAVKILNCAEQFNDKIRNELLIMMECNCEHVVRCFGSEVGPGGVWIVMEFCAGGSVGDILRTKRLSEADIASVLECVLRGLDYLHSRRKIHRDVKAANILLDGEGSARLADFGVAGQLLHTYGDKDTFIGSPYWMSPQILAKSRYNSKTDIWSLGITAIQLAEGKAPYSNLHPFRAMFLIQKNPAKGLSEPGLFSPELNKFIKRCLAHNPEDRPTAKQLLSDPFILGFSRGRVLIDQVERRTTPLEKESAGTIIEHPQADFESGPILWGNELVQSTRDTIVIKESHVTDEPQFIKYIKENSKRVDEFPGKENSSGLWNKQKDGFSAMLGREQPEQSKLKDSGLFGKLGNSGFGKVPQSQTVAELQSKINVLKRQRDQQIEQTIQKYATKLEPLQSKLQSLRKAADQKKPVIPRSSKAVRTRL